MKNTFLMFAIGIMSVTTLFSCRDSEEKETVIVREVEVEKKEPVEEKKGAFERTAEKVDQEINKEIDEEIEKIGDDN